MPLNSHNMIFTTSRYLRVVLVAALERTLNGKLQQVESRSLISAVKALETEYVGKVSIFWKILEFEDAT